nr:hypothetical protein HAGR004_36060 [Bdellovibrio sp. HAGR004]
MNSSALDRKLAYMGIQLANTKAGSSAEWLDLEGTLYEASLEVPHDGRLFSLLCSWVAVHGDYVIIEKLMKLQKKAFSPWLVAIAICAANLGFHQWKRLIKKPKEVIALGDVKLALSSIALKGEEPHFRENGFLIPKGSIRIRASDVLSQERLAKKNPQYRNRLLFGSCWRADIITAIEAGMKTPYQISKTLGCTYEPAHRIFKEYSLAMA